MVYLFQTRTNGGFMGATDAAVIITSTSGANNMVAATSVTSIEQCKVLWDLPLPCGAYQNVWPRKVALGRRHSPDLERDIWYRCCLVTVVCYVC